MRLLPLIILSVLIFSCSSNYDWSFSYGDGKAGNQPKKIVSDEEYYYAFGTNLREGTPINLILKFDKAGKIIWDRYVGINTKSSKSSEHYYKSYFRKFFMSDSGNFYVAGYKEDENQNREAYLIKLDKDGIQITDLVLPNFTNLESIHQIGDQVIVLATGGFGHNAIISFDKKLNQLWQSEISVPFGHDFIGMLKENQGHLYLFQTHLIGKKFKFGIKKIDQEGNNLWIKDYNNPSDFKQIAKKVNGSIAYNFSIANAFFLDSHIYLLGNYINRPYSHFVVVDENNGNVVDNDLVYLADLSPPRQCDSNHKILHEPSVNLSNHEWKKQVFIAMDLRTNAFCHCTILTIDFAVNDFLINDNDTILIGFDVIDDYKYNWRIVKY